VACFFNSWHVSASQFALVRLDAVTPPEPHSPARPSVPRARVARRTVRFRAVIGSSIIDNLRALVLEPRRQQQSRSEVLVRFVLQKPALGRRGALGTDTGRRSHVDRVEVEAILDFGAIGIAQLVVEILLFRQRFVSADVEREMMRRAGAETNCPGRGRVRDGGSAFSRRRPCAPRSGDTHRRYQSCGIGASTKKRSCSTVCCTERTVRGIRATTSGLIWSVVQPVRVSCVLDHFKTGRRMPEAM
jgi:hypothetical protein